MRSIPRRALILKIEDTSASVQVQGPLLCTTVQVGFE